MLPPSSARPMSMYVGSDTAYKVAGAAYDATGTGSLSLRLQKEHETPLRRSIPQQIHHQNQESPMRSTSTFCGTRRRPSALSSNVSSGSSQFIPATTASSSSRDSGYHSTVSPYHSRNNLKPAGNLKIQAAANLCVAPMTASLQGRRLLDSPFDSDFALCTASHCKTANSPCNENHVYGRIDDDNQADFFHAPNRCPYCKKEFRGRPSYAKRNLRRHKQKHCSHLKHQASRSACQFLGCGSTFSGPDGLKEHMESQHSGIKVDMKRRNTTTARISAH